MKKDTFFITAIIILFVFNLLTLAYVMFGLKKDNPPFPPGPPAGMVVEDKLQLTPEQRLQFEELKKEHRKAMEFLLNTSRDLHDSYLNELKNDDIDTVKRSNLLKQIGDNQEEMDKVTFTHFEKLRAICTPEQKKLYNVFIDEIARSLRPSDRMPDGRPVQNPPPPGR